MRFESLISKERISQLKSVLKEYSDILHEGKEGNKTFSGMIMKTFLFGKPLSSIELYEANSKRLELFITVLERFFFIKKHHSIIYFSRFRTLCDVAMDIPRDWIGLSDEHADLAGLLYGYSPKKIAKYCLERGKHYLIKLK